MFWEIATSLRRMFIPLEPGEGQASSTCDTRRLQDTRGTVTSQPARSMMLIAVCDWACGTA